MAGSGASAGLRRRLPPSRPDPPLPNGRYMPTGPRLARPSPISPVPIQDARNPARFGGMGRPDLRPFRKVPDLGRMIVRQTRPDPYRFRGRPGFRPGPGPVSAGAQGLLK